jgi:hypothetical protein
MIFLRFLSSFTISSQVNPEINPTYDVLAWFRRDDGRHLAQELRVVVAIGIEQQPDRHSKKPRRFPRPSDVDSRGDQRKRYSHCSLNARIARQLFLRARS